MFETREAFLRAIYDDWADDTPRLVYADWLDENGDATFAAFIRIQCERARLAKEEAIPERDARRAELEAKAYSLYEAVRIVHEFEGWPSHPPYRGFAGITDWHTSAAFLDDPNLRERIVARCPQVFGATGIVVRPAIRNPAERLRSAAPIENLLGQPATANVTRLVLKGSLVVEGIAGGIDGNTALSFDDAVLRPVVTSSAVIALASGRACRRLTELDLTYNDLDNDSARSLIRSPHLGRLQSLKLLDGNRIRGRVWQDVLERFGEDVAS